ncbi:hypothetical protein KXV85_000754, partial [Aspergillus fumigatus]
AVRRTQCRRPRGGPQRQPHQRPGPAPRPRDERRHDAVDHRHRGDPASGRAVQAQPLHRPLYRGAARHRGRLLAGLPHQQEAGRRPRSARHPPPGAGRSRRPPDPRLGDLRARHDRRQIRPRHRTRRDHRVRRGRRAQPQAVPPQTAAALHLRIHLFLASRLHRRRPLGLRRAQGLRRAARARKPCRCRRGGAGAGLRRARRARLQPLFGRAVRARHHPQPLCRPHLHPADPERPRDRRAHEACRQPHRHRGQADRADRRLA